MSLVRILGAGTLIAVVLLAESPLAAETSSPVGMILESKGDVTLERSGQSKPARIAELLYPGDTLRASSGNAKLLFCPSSQAYSVPAGAGLKLGADKVTVSGGAAAEPQLVRRCALPQVALGKESLERTGAIRVRSSGLPPIPLHLGGWVGSDRPTFSWKAVEGAEQYRITVRDERGDQLWQATTAQTWLAYPADRPALQAGLYEWQAEARQEDRTVAQRATRFQIKPLAEAPSAEGGLEEALRLEQAGYFAEAAALFRNIQRENPQDDRWSHHLAWLYDQAGLTVSAEEELRQVESKPN